MSLITPQRAAAAAVGRLSRLWRNARLDLRYGAFAGGFQKSRHAGATWVVNTDYDVMPQLFRGRIDSDDTLVDIGCGRGRVINWWLNEGYSNRIIGLELVPEVAAATRERLRRFPQISIVHGDAIANLPADGTFLYLANSFSDESTMHRFMTRFEELYRGKPKVRLFYYNPVFVDLFAKSDRWIVDRYRVAIPGKPELESGHTRLCRLRLAGAPS